MADAEKDGEAETVKVPVPVTVRVVVPYIGAGGRLDGRTAAATPVANPVLLIVATEGTLDVQVAELVGPACYRRCRFRSP